MPEINGKTAEDPADLVETLLGPDSNPFEPISLTDEQLRGVNESELKEQLKLIADGINEYEASIPPWETLALEKARLLAGIQRWRILQIRALVIHASGSISPNNVGRQNLVRTWRENSSEEIRTRIASYYDLETQAPDTGHRPFYFRNLPGIIAANGLGQVERETPLPYSKVSRGSAEDNDERELEEGMKEFEAEVGQLHARARMVNMELTTERKCMLCRKQQTGGSGIICYACLQHSSTF